MATAVPTDSEIEQVVTLAHAIEQSMSRVLAGVGDAVRATVVTVLAEGHLLMEDVPGVGKTTLARALAASIDGTVGRIQFTPDLLPSDVTGVSVYRQATQEFEFRPGPVHANVVIADEINRASPKTQSALLESMQEKSVTVDGVTRQLPRPFIVLATQNPLDMEGTYPLPEAQRDRFMMRISLGYPDSAAELALLETHEGDNPLEAITPVATVGTLAAAISVCSRIWAAPAVKQYIVNLVRDTRADPSLHLGASPRASLQLLAAAKARAAMAGRNHVLPDDVKELAIPVLAHRVLMSGPARGSDATPMGAIADVLARTEIPRAAATDR